MKLQYTPIVGNLLKYRSGIFFINNLIQAQCFLLAVLVSKAKLGEQQQDLTASRNVETLKQKIMKLRKENEVLKRQLFVLKEN